MAVQKEVWNGALAQKYDGSRVWNLKFSGSHSEEVKRNR